MTARSPTNSVASAGTMRTPPSESRLLKCLRFNTSKPGDERINFKEYVDRMKEVQNDVYDITGKSIAVVFSSSFLENLHKNGYEAIYMADPWMNMTYISPRSSTERS